MSLGRTLLLNNGRRIPQIGFGTWQAKPGEVERAVTEALKAGYRHIDAALIYRLYQGERNQAEVGKGIRDSGVARNDIWLTSKLWNNSHRAERVEKDLDLTLSQLDTPYLDLYLVHWPVPFLPGDSLFPKTDKGEAAIDWDGPSIADTWKEVVRVYKQTDKVRAIGVSNFTAAQIDKLIEATGVVPAVNQIEAHPTLQQPELYQYSKDKGIVITAYSPLGNNLTGKTRVIDSPDVQAIAKRLGKDPAQVLIAWATKNGFSVIPKSVTPSRIRSNFETFDLPDDAFEELNRIGAAHRQRANVPAEYSPRWCINVFNEPSEQEFKPVW